MARKHDLTALLPFPTQIQQPTCVDTEAPQSPRPARRGSRTDSRPDSARPDSARADRWRDDRWRDDRWRDDRWRDDRPALRDEPTSRPGAVRLDQLDLTELVRHHASTTRARSRPALVGGPWNRGCEAGTATDRSAEARGSSPDGAVPSPGFYLDLIGAVTVMALVLLAAILV